MAQRKQLLDLLDDIEALMFQARELGLHRTKEKLHHALMEARSEMFEALPAEEYTVEFTFGPVREQQP